MEYETASSLSKISKIAAVFLGASVIVGCGGAAANTPPPAAAARASDVDDVADHFRLDPNRGDTGSGGRQTRGPSDRAYPCGAEVARVKTAVV